MSGFVVVARRQVDRERTLGRITERVAGEHRAGEGRRLQPPGERGGPGPKRRGDDVRARRDWRSAHRRPPRRQRREEAQHVGAGHDAERPSAVVHQHRGRPLQHRHHGRHRLADPGGRQRRREMRRDRRVQRRTDRERRRPAVRVRRPRPPPRLPSPAAPPSPPAAARRRTRAAPRLPRRPSRRDATWTSSGSSSPLRASTSPSVASSPAGQEAVAAHPVVVEDLRQVAAAGIRQQHDDHPVRRQLAPPPAARPRSPARTSRRPAAPPRGPAGAS